MIQGYLKILVLTELEIRPLSGYALMKVLKDKYQKSPSPGSMYPLLSTLEERKLIKGKEEGKSTIYTITAKGKRRIKKLLKEKESVIKKHIGLCNTIEEISGDDGCRFDIKKIEPKIIRNMDILSELKATLIRHIESRKFEQNEKEIRKILKEANKRLKGLKWDS